MKRFRSIIISANNNAPYFFSGVRCVGNYKRAIFLSMRPSVLFHQLQITGRRHPVLRNGASRSLHAFVIRTLSGHRPFCSRTHCHFSTNCLRDHDRVDRSIRQLHRLLKLWSLMGICFSIQKTKCVEFVYVFITPFVERAVIKG